MKTQEQLEAKKLTKKIRDLHVFSCKRILSLEEEVPKLY